MQQESLAERLIAAESEAERESLLAANPSTANVELAIELKDICYKFWTIEPVKAQNASFALNTLARFSPEPKIIAFKIWINGIAALTRGDYLETIDQLTRAAEHFRLIGENHLAAQTDVSKLFALAVLSRYDEAIEIGKSALTVFESYGDELSAGKIEKNLGSLLGRRGRYSESEKFFQSAQQRFLVLDDQPELAMVENNLALIKTYQNDFRAAEEIYERALKRIKAADLRATEAEMQMSLGNLALFRGRYDEALKFLEKSRQNYSALNLPHQTAVTNLEIGEVYIELNLLEEAINIFSRAAEQFSSLKMRAEEARARALLGKALSGTAKFQEALDELKLAEDLYFQEENEIGAAVVKLIKTDLYLRESNFNSAAKLSDEAARIFEKARNWRLFCLSKFFQAEAEGQLNHKAKARQILADTLQLATEKEQPQIQWLLDNSLGIIAEQDQDYSSAEKHFIKSVEIIENLRSPLAADEFRTSFLADKLIPYQKLASICRQNPERIVEAFMWIERSRSQALLDLLEIAGEKKISADAQTQEEISRLQEELNWFYSLLNRPIYHQQPHSQSESEKWQEEIKIREREINSLFLHLEATNEKINQKNADLDFKKLQNLIGQNRILLEFTEFEGELAVFAITENEIQLFENLGKSSDVQRILESVHFQFGTLRFGAKALEKHLPILKQRTDKHLAELYEILLQGLEEIIENKHLIIIPNGNLHYVPFHALFDGENYVIQRREISYAPSASVLEKLLAKQNLKNSKTLAVGFADERVPQVEKEVLHLKDVLPDAEVLIGKEATFAATKNILAQEQFGILHLACHGQFRPENPLFSSLHLADGWSTVREAAKLSLQNSVVVLSACETGLNKIAAGDELLGLVRGFLAAGANSIILTLWTVNDESASALMQEFYKNIAFGNSLATSLRLAQLTILNQSVHPYFWSPFALVGCW